MRSIKSRYGKYKCPSCNKLMEKDVLITNPGNGWVHLECAMGQGEANFEPKPEPVVVLSEEQQAIIDFITNETGNLAVNAGAGTGKSFTLIQAAKALPNNFNILYVAFNKSICNEMQPKAPRNMTVKTSHALGFNAVKKGLNIRPRIDSSKVWKIAKTLTPEKTPEDYKNRSAIVKLIDKFKMTQETDLDLLAARFDIDIDPNYLKRYFGKILDASNDDNSRFDFADMIYRPSIDACQFDSYDIVLVDECQDLNYSQQELLRRMQSTNPDLRYIFVGDPKQAIYGFAGADVDSFNNLVEDFNCHQLTLSVTRRCPQAVVNLIKQANLKPGFKALPDAPEGIVGDWSEIGHGAPPNPQPGDIMVTRCWAPALPVFYNLIKQGIGAQLIGRDFGKEIVKLINDNKGHDLEKTLDNLEEWRDKQVAKINKRRIDPTHKNTQIEMLDDKVDCILFLANECDTVLEVTTKIDNLFAERKEHNTVRISSIHRSKGLEGDTIWVIAPDKLPLYDSEQEYNLEYVAYSRAKKRLIFLR